MQVWIEEGFGDFEVPEEILEHPHLVDTSWRNDACPSWETGPLPSGREYCVWVDARDPELSEFQRSRREGRWKRYNVQLVVDGDRYDIALETDDLAEVLDFLAKEINCENMHKQVYYAYSPAYDDSRTGYYATPEAALDAYWSENRHTEDERRRAKPIAVAVAVDAALLDDATWLAADGRPSPALGLGD